MKIEGIRPFEENLEAVGHTAFRNPSGCGNVYTCISEVIVLSILPSDSLHGLNQCTKIERIHGSWSTYVEVMLMQIEQLN